MRSCGSEEEWKLTLQIVAGNQEGSESRFKFCVAEELIERRFQSVGRIFREKHLAFGRDDIFSEDCGAILNVEIEKLI